MKSYELIALMQPKERRRFAQRLQTHRRTVLQQLFAILCKQVKREQLPEKERLYQELFSEPYTPELDYKLRHELRLLNQELSLFLAEIQEQSEGTLTEQRYLLDVLAARQAWDLWDKTLNRAQRQAEKQSDYGHTCRLLAEQFKVLQQRRELNEDSLAEMRDLLQGAAQEQLKQTGEQLLDLRIRLSHTEVNLRYFRPDYPAQLPETYLPLELFEGEALHRFLDLQAQMYFLSGKDKIAVLQESLELHSEVASIRPRYEKTRNLSLGTIAMEYSMQRQWEAADEAYQELRPFFMEQKDLNNSMQVYNYMMNTLYLGKYHEVLELHAAYSEVVGPGHKMYYRYLYTACWAYIFLGENEKGLQLILHDNLQQRSDFDNYYARLQYAILYYQMGNWEQCERELLNMQQRMRYKKQELNKIFELQLEGLSRLLKIEWGAHSASEKQAQRQALLQEMEPKISISQQAYILPWYWLKKQLETPKKSPTSSQS